MLDALLIEWMQVTVPSQAGQSWILSRASRGILALLSSHSASYIDSRASTEVVLDVNVCGLLVSCTPADQDGSPKLPNVMSSSWTYVSGVFDLQIHKWGRTSQTPCTHQPDYMVFASIGLKCMDHLNLLSQHLLDQFLMQLWICLSRWCSTKVFSSISAWASEEFEDQLEQVEGFNLSFAHQFHLVWLWS